jgi:hypothetical protein
MTTLTDRIRFFALTAAVLMTAASCQPVRTPRPGPVPEVRKPAPTAAAVPAGKLNIFRDAVHILHGKTVETFLRIEELEGKYAVMATDVDDTLTLDSFTPVLEGRKLRTLTDLRFREAAADVLNRYAALLDAAAKDGMATGGDRAAGELAGSLAIFRNATVPDGVGRTEAAGIFDGVSAALDGIRREPDRTAALKTLMDGAQVDLQRLSSLIVRDHGKFKDLVDKMIRGIVESANARRPIHEDYIDPALTAFDSRIAALIRESREIRAALDAVMDGFAQAPEAHFAIRNILGRDLKGLPALQSLLQKAREADRRYRALESKTPPLP